jgi:hypothetical protein
MRCTANRRTADRPQRTATYVTDVGSLPVAILDERMRATTSLCSVTRQGGSHDADGG